MPDEVKAIEIVMEVGEDTVTISYVDPAKIAGMLSEEKSLGGFLCELRDMERTDDEPEPIARPPRQITEREVALIAEFEAMVDRLDYTPAEIRALICGIVAGFADKSGIELVALHEDIDAAYAYRLAHPVGRPS